MVPGDPPVDPRCQIDSHVKNFDCTVILRMSGDQFLLANPTGTRNGEDDE
ncbi:MAG: hypothetical protein VX404_00720 [Planctomycetota bacterium]|nr:hypothetical protein [Planctomycetota bacterium]